MISKIATFDLFANISRDDLRIMLHCINPTFRKYEKGGIVALAGDPMPGIGVVLQGEVEIARENASGSRMILSIAGEGDTFGEMAAFSGGGAWPATVTARKSCTAFFMPSGKFTGGCANSCSSHKLLIQNMLRILSEKALHLSRKVEYLTIKSMRGKIANFLLEQHRRFSSASFILPMNKNDLADFLNVSRPSMSREFARMKEEGVIDYYLSGIRILDMERLKKMSLL